MQGGNYLVTGAGSGIGRATALALDEAGAERLWLIDKNAAALEETVNGINNSESITKIMDVADPLAWADFAFAGGLNGAVICAGLSRAATISEMAYEEWRQVISVNLDGAFLSLQAALRQAAEGASLVAVSSATAHKAVPMTAAYGASKAGLSQLVKVAALEAAPLGIRVNAIAPGGVKTPMFSDLPFFRALIDEQGSEAAAWAALGQSVPLGQYAEPEEVAGMILFLLGAQSGTMTGAVLHCDGGYGI